MKRLSFLCLLIFLSPSLHAQNWEFEAPDYDQIEEHIQDESSELYYPQLMDRYLHGDSTMSLEQKRHLYYGYRYQSGYSPYGHSTYLDSLGSIMGLKDHSAEELQRIITYTDSLLAENPFSIRAMNQQLYAYDHLGDTASFEKIINRTRTVYDALMSTGDGTTKEHAFYVLYTSHEYELINVLGLEFGGSQSLIENYDYLELAENDYALEGLYFDVSPCLDHLSLLMKED